MEHAIRLCKLGVWKVVMNMMSGSSVERDLAGSYSSD